MKSSDGDLAFLSVEADGFLIITQIGRCSSLNYHVCSGINSYSLIILDFIKRFKEYKI